jgi:ligand-binding SRPBCC domain-containing protein
VQEHRVERSVRLAAGPEEVWAVVTTPEGINDELRPWLRMTVPKAFAGRTLADLDPPEELGRSWIFFLGVLPFDWDQLGIEAIGDGWFRERSSMLSCTSWGHDRTLVADGGGTRLTDSLVFVLRRPFRWLPGSGRFYAFVVGKIFGHRHRRLARRFGAA